MGRFLCHGAESSPLRMRKRKNQFHWKRITVRSRNSHAEAASTRWKSITRGIAMSARRRTSSRKRRDFQLQRPRTFLDKGHYLTNYSSSTAFVENFEIARMCEARSKYSKAIFYREVLFFFFFFFKLRVSARMLWIFSNVESRSSSCFFFLILSTIFENMFTGSRTSKRVSASQVCFSVRFRRHL